ncbi:phosphonate ABC transporter, permease protein PhnE [Rhodococcus sp. B50]|uniref:phosphonate ABC transporter, permease protein PhnE n=1 Tax=Rhodococcus sp. B50 TaxID=2682847 RepID=UPI001BD6A219|nr:phosphonate ABC transporter, permease protein PhnE [Rhodococcus sp. B50]MBS9374231.1 Phosphate-import permease protein PhnE [Rhodococcus sp. B50]
MSILAPPSTETRSHDTGRDRRRTIAAGWAVVAIAVTASAAYIDFAPTTLFDGLDSMAGLIERMLPPRLDDPGRIGVLALETLLMAVLGTVLAAVASIPLAFLAARNTTPHPVLYRGSRTVITFCRAMPDLLFAVLFVRALGIGVLPGILALALHSIGMLGKLFADAIEQTDAGPREAVRSTGVGYVREMINAVLPQVVPAWTANFVYRIDINLRTSVVLGFVGAGGIGFALQDALRGLVYPRALGIVCVILVIIAAMEVVAILVRRALLTPSVNGPGRERLSRIVFSVTVAGATLFALVALRIDPRDLFTWIGPSLEVFTRLVPPDFTAVGWDLADAVVQTLAIGAVATAVGAVFSLPFGILAASNVSPHPTVYAAARAVVLVVRAIPELILAVIFVAAIGLGPVAGACALAIGSVGFLGKLVADAVEEIDLGPLDAVRAVGGGWWKTLFAAVIPQVIPSVVGSTLYLLDVNIRTSTVLGVVGAGGVGFLLFEAVRTLNFEFAGAIVVIVFVVVYVIERMSGWIRSKVV